MKKNITATGIIIDEGIFLNPVHIVKMRKYNLRENAGYWIEIFSTNGKDTTLTFETQSDRDVAFDEIINILYGDDCAVFNRRKK